MKDAERRRFVQAALAAGGASLLRGVRAQAPAATSASLLLAPRRALVIGNSRYHVTPLANPANDARAIGEQLQLMGFEVSVGLDLKRAEMLEAIRRHGEALLRGKPVGVFYFAGHGVQLSWRNYLLPVDAKIDRIEDVQAQCVDVNAVIEQIGKAANPMNVVILDACRENPFGRDFLVEQKGLSQVDAPLDTLLAYATAPGNVASDGEGANGLYTGNLLREMKVPETKIEDVFKRVRLAVRRRSNGLQVPWESTSLEEDFYFLPPKELKKQAEEERERDFKAQQALWEKVQEAERQRRAEAERARLRKEEMERAEQARLAGQHRLEEAERERKAKEEAALREQQLAAAAPLPVEDYLRQYPSGYFSELAEFQLDRVLAREGEKKVEAVAAPKNPYTHGTAKADTRYRVGDSYTYETRDLYSKAISGTRTQTITDITEAEVIYNEGRAVTDLLGNPLKAPDGRRFSANQRNPTEFVVGKTWSTRFVTTTRQSAELQTEMTFRIVGTERITVPAGTFDTFVVIGRGWSTGAGQTAQIVGKAWFAPARLRRAVATELVRKSVFRTMAAERQELVAFQES